jgi:hypothetical protein
MSFEVRFCEVLYFGPHRVIAGRTTGVVRAQTGFSPTPEIKSALLGHAAHQLNRIKQRHAMRAPAANELRPAIAAE